MALAALPRSFRGLPVLTSIRREPMLYGRIHGVLRPLHGGFVSAGRAIVINDSCFRPNGRFGEIDDFTATVIHEWTHAFNNYDPETGTIHRDWRDNLLMKEYAEVSGPWEFRAPTVQDIGRFYVPGMHKPGDIIEKKTEVWIFKGIEALTDYSKCSPQEHLSDTMVHLLLSPESAERNAPKCSALLSKRFGLDSAEPTQP